MYWQEHTNTHTHTLSVIVCKNKYYLALFSMDSREGLVSARVVLIKAMPI